MTSIAISFSSVADKLAIAIALRYLPKGESYSKAKGSAGISASFREIPVIGHIAVACLACSIFMFPFVAGWLAGWHGRMAGDEAPARIVAWLALGVKLGAKCLIAWRFSRPVRPVRPSGLLRLELMELVEWKEL